MSKVVAEVTMRLADSAILPLHVSRLEDLLEEGWDYLQQYKSDMENVDLSLGEGCKEVTLTFLSARVPPYVHFTTLPPLVQKS